MSKEIYLEEVIITIDNVDVIKGPLSYELNLIAHNLSKIIGVEDGVRPEIHVWKRGHNANATLNGKNIEYGALLREAMATRCRRCDNTNPPVYLAPRFQFGIKSVVCLDCANRLGWLDKDGNLRPGIRL